MSWIKRNLFFVIGSVVALGLLGWAGFYNYSRWKLNADARDQINAQYEELKRLNNLNPHPGKGSVDNIAAARRHKGMLADVTVRAARQFQPILPIPSSEKITSEEFASALRRAMDQMQRDAVNASVALPPNYGFSFEAQRGKLVFAAGSLGPLAVQLGEVKTICDIFNKEKVNSLDAIRRERVSADDLNGPQTDYLELHSETNELAVISPYEISFRCFSPELASVLAQFASSPHGIIVKSINVQPAPAVGAAEATTTPSYTPVPIAPVFTPGPGGPPPGMPRRYGNFDRPVPAPVPVAPAPTASRGGLQTFINERQLRVTMLIEIVKLPPKK